MRVIGLGAGGHAKVVIETLCALNRYDIVGVLDTDERLWGSSVLGVDVLGDDSQLCRLHKSGVRHAFIGVGSGASTDRRRAAYERARREGFEVVDAIHPAAYIAPSASVGDGATVLARAVIHTAARVGANVLVNTGAIIEHDCIVGDHVHVATGAVLAGSVVVGTGAHIGAGASIRHEMRIGAGSIVGVGAVVVDDVPERVVVAGVPARVLRRL